MWRFLLPAVVMMAALIVLFAGAFGDMKSLPDLSDRIIGIIGGVEPRHASPPPPVPSAAASAEQQAAREFLQRQITVLQQQASALQAQVSQRSHDLDAARTEAGQLRQGLNSARTETDKLRQDIDALHQQRKAEEAALARQKAQAQQTAAIAPPPPRPAPAPQSPPAPTPGPSASQQLLTARQWLATGRPDEARRVLTMVQTQMVLRPVTPDQPTAQGGNPSATDVGNAIRWLDMGANGQAMQALNRAIDNTGANDTPRPWSGYAPGPPPGYPPGMPGYYSNNTAR